ncbi:uncharacterized protein LOC143377926 [Andrena cerasifolii]|uniref:uncharacterized protein LOC143377926 n=1 Tax=Andrena cerasifolii TaxID=2819439 RepID=UPI0040376105
MSPYIATLILLWGLLDLSSVEPMPASHRHFHHRHRWSDYHLEESVPRQLSLRRLTAEPNRRWRSLDPWAQGDETGHSSGRPKRYYNIAKLPSDLFQIEAEQAKDDSLCGYTVTPIEPIYDSNGTFILKDLKEIKCRHPGGSCHTGKSHCCIQTFISVTITYFSNGTKYHRPVKINTGCVCAHRGIVNATPDLD